VVVVHEERFLCVSSAILYQDGAAALSFSVDKGEARNYCFSEGAALQTTEAISGIVSEI
jgi:hypothetical protein